MAQNDNLVHQTIRQSHALMEDTGSGAQGALTALQKQPIHKNRTRNFILITNK